MTDVQAEPEDAASTSDQRLKPKIEDDEDIRMYAAVSFAVLLIAVGVPLWWKTTEVYRVHVPYGHIAELQEKELFFNINVHVHSLKDRMNSLEEGVQKYSNFGPLRIKFIHHEMNSSSPITRADSLLKLEKLQNFQSDKPGEIIFVEVPQLPKLTKAHVAVGAGRTIYFSSEASGSLLARVLDTWLLQSDSLRHTLESMQSPFRPQMQDSTARRRVPPSTQYDLMITIVHPEPDRRTIAWDLQSVVEDQLSLLLKALSPVSQMRVKSQWLYLVKFEIRPKQIVSESGPWYALSQETLPHIITPLEKKLGTSVSSNPSIQLVLYIPPCNWSPLHIVRSHLHPPAERPKDAENAFLSPRWGGIQIYNPPIDTCSDSDTIAEHVPDAALIMSVFRKQLKLLLGVHTLENITDVDQLPLPRNSLRAWESDILLRTRTLEQITSAKLTLKSLAQLLEEMNNIVITAEVGECIWEAIRSVTAAMEALQRDDLASAFNASQRAFVNAETAFTDPSLLALLYFPEDQKYAVYIPLFLPIMIPVLMSLRSICSWLFRGMSVKSMFSWIFRGKRKQKED